MRNNKVLFIGPKEIYSLLKENYPYWDFQSSIAGIPEFSSALEKEGNGLFSTETPCLIFYGRLFYDPLNKNISPITVQNNKKYFIDVVTYLAPYVNVQVLVHEGDSTYNQEMRSMIEDATEENIDFIDYDNFHEDLINNMRGYIEDERSNYDSLQNLLDLCIENEDEGENEEQEESEDPEEIAEDNDKLISLNGNGRVITITSTKGGAGKSTTSALIAAYLDKYSDKKVCLVDLDVVASQMGILLGPIKPTILTVFNKWEEEKSFSEEDLLSCKVDVKAFNNIDVYLSPEPRWLEYLTFPFYNYLIEKLKTMYDIVLLDTSSMFISPLAEKVISPNKVIFPKSDHIVLVMDMDNASKGVVRLIRHLTAPEEKDGLGIDVSKLSIVLNKVVKGIELDFEELEKISQGVNIVTMLPENSPLVIGCSKKFRIDMVLEDPFFLEGIKEVTEGALIDD